MSGSATGSDYGTLLVFATLLGLIPAIIANHKGLSFVRWWIFGALLFILALPLAIMASPEAGTTLKKCPHCAEWVQREAKVCKHCSRDIPEATAGWYPNPDPAGEGFRWWDGQRWTEQKQ